VLIGFAAGGGTDIQARIVAPRLGEALGTNIVVENKPGAGTSIAAAEVARAAPDGYTLLYSFNGAFAQIPFTLAGGVPYDPVKDFAPIALVAGVPFALIINPAIPAKTLAEFIAYAKSKPGLARAASARSLMVLKRDSA